jgi:hypothetical protein
MQELDVQNTALQMALDGGEGAAYLIAARLLPDANAEGALAELGVPAAAGAAPADL